MSLNSQRLCLPEVQLDSSNYTTVQDNHQAKVSKDNLWYFSEVPPFKLDGVQIQSINWEDGSAKQGA